MSAPAPIGPVKHDEGGAARADAQALPSLELLESANWPLLAEALAAGPKPDAEQRGRMWRRIAARLEAEREQLPAARGAGTARAEPQVVNVLRESGGWRRLSPLAEFKVLYRDAQQLSWLLRLAPGGSVPAHGHDGGVEECLVLEGEVLLNGERFRQGDFQAALPGSRHEQVQAGTGGCTVYLRSPAARYRELAVLSGVEEAVAAPLREAAQGWRRWWERR
jgi:quercetin dioxygenase-like cupin family protein